MLADIATRSFTFRLRRLPELAGLLMVAGSVMAFLLLQLAADRYSLWIDEAITGLVVREFSSMDQLLAFLRSSTGSEPAQPLYYVLIWLWTRIAGDSEAALRTPSLVFSLGASAAIWFALRQLGISTRIASAAAATFIALPVVMWYSLEARPYALIVFTAAVHLTLTLTLLRRPTLLRLAVLALSTIVVALTYSIAGVAAFLALVVALALRRLTVGNSGPRGALAIDTAVGLTTFVAVAGIALASLARSGAGRLPDGLPAVFASFGYAAYELVLGRSLGFSVTDLRVAGGVKGAFELFLVQPGTFAVTLLCGLCVIFVAIKGVRGLRPTCDVHVLAAVGPWIVVGAMFCAYAVYPGFVLLGRHLLFVLPAITLLLIVGLSRGSRRGQLAAALAIWFVGSVAFAGLLFDPRYAKDDFRAAARIVNDCRFQPGQIVLLASERGFTYYGVQGLYGLQGRSNHFQAEDPGSGDIQAGINFLRAKGVEPALIIVDISRFDRDGYVDKEVHQNPLLHRLDLASLTMLSTVSLDGCAHR